MKFLVLLFIILVICFAIYFLVSFKFKKLKKKKISKKPLWIALSVFAVLLVLLVLLVRWADSQPDTWCSTSHTTTTEPPAFLKTANDYFELGNYDFDIGKCNEAINAYTKSISLNPKSPQTYNNRAYTYMRLREYQLALNDLNKALSLNPNYTHALMNRGDLFNYYYQINKAAAIYDYEKIISLDPNHTAEPSVCGHLFLAKHNGWNFKTIVDFLLGDFRNCK